MLAGLLLAETPAAGQARDTLDRGERISRELDSRLRLTVPADQPVLERLLIDHRLSTRTAFLAIDDEFSSTRILRQYEAQFQVLAQLDGVHTFYGRLRTLYNDYNSGDSFDERGDNLEEPIGDRYWYQYDDHRRQIVEDGEAGPISFTAKVGRDYFVWGSGLSLANVMYMAYADVNLGPIGIKGLFGQTPASQTVDWDASRPGYDSRTKRRYYGGELEWRGSQRHRPFVSYLVQRDRGGRDFEVIDTALAEIPTSFNYDSEYLGFGMRGTLGPQWAYRVEVVHETGDALSSPFAPGREAAQTEEDVDAWAGVGTLTFLLRDDADTRFTFECAGGSGDNDRLDANDTFGGNEPGTDDNAFNSLGFINTGLAFAPELTNLLMLRGGFSTSPLPRGQQYDWLRVGADFFVFMKVERDAPISWATTDDRLLGAEIDLHLDWQLASDVVASIRYGVFFPTDALVPGQDDVRHFLYTGVTIEF
jgi:hypothetical protein